MPENVWKLNDSPIFWVDFAAGAAPPAGPKLGGITSYHLIGGEDIAQKPPEVAHQIKRGDHRHMQGD